MVLQYACACAGTIGVFKPKPGHPGGMPGSRHHPTAKASRVNAVLKTTSSSLWTQQCRSLAPSRNQWQSRKTVCTSSDSLRVKVSDFVKTPLYSKYVQGAVFVGVLAAVDAGYSGDWSRIGAISQQDEFALQQILPSLAAFHAFSAIVSGIAANLGGRPVVWPVAKATLVGGLAMFEQLLQLPEE